MLAYNPHVLGRCDHTFCLSCTNLHSGKPCPRCGIFSEPGICRPDLKIENLLKAYLPMAKFLGIDVTNTCENDVFNNNGLSAKPVAVTPSVASLSSKPPKNITKTENIASPAQVVKKRERAVSLNESLNSTINGTPVSKINKRNQKGETQLHVVGVNENVLVFCKFYLLPCVVIGLSQAGHSKS